MAAVARIEGYAIVSADGMLADAGGVMPEALKQPADQRFFEAGLDAADVMVHGRHSHEQQANSSRRLRLVVTRSVDAVEADPSNALGRLWNPAGASLESALDALGVADAVVAVIGGTDVFGLFLDRYDAFHLTRGPKVRLPGGRPVFPSVPNLTPEAVLAEHGLVEREHEVLDAPTGLVVTHWVQR
ncbi:MAG TPA: hypothetical protein VKT30_00230 [Caulobacteraceae bacterium]|nr:hypothetical protein [Caulobacteraceae bacterium]